MRRGDADRVTWPNPSGLLRRFIDDIDRFFERFGPEHLMPRFGRGDEWMPDIDVVERHDAIVVRADLPGVTKKDLKVEVTGSAVTIDGHRSETREEESEGYYRSERRYGHFSRTVALPPGTKPEEAKASFSNGVLEVVIPAPGRGAGRRRVEIQGD